MVNRKLIKIVMEIRRVFSISLFIVSLGIILSILQVQLDEKREYHKRHVIITCLFLF
ncbi:hypothetical protein [Clostridium sardiniense]|uniref:hypothetical protein n=1 Tax=Clostridium sardiniense TaxID=29369 RepID=UPI003D34B182